MHSITVRLALVFLFLLMVVVVFGVFGLGSLSYFNDVRAQIRDRWLPSTGVLSDLNNVTSDFRAAEGASLLAANAAQHAASEALIAQLDHSIAVAENSFQQISQESAQETLYLKFAADWSQYRQIVDRVQALARSGDQAAAIDLYSNASKSAYDAASDTLDQLTARSIARARESSAREDRAYGRAQWLILATIALTGLSVAAAMVYVRRSISAPILSLAERMRRLAANETGVEIEGIERQDEIGEMACAVVVFRTNAIELMSSQIGLEQQATMLRERLAEEQRLMLLQRNFVSMASHEFRTPLTIIDSHAQRLLSSGTQGEEAELAERVRKIRNAVKRMTHLIKNLIDSMRIMDGEVQLYFHPAKMNVVPLLQEVCQLHREIAAQSQIYTVLSHHGAYIHGDASLLFQVFSNLLSNAIKYSAPGVLIKVLLECANDEVAISIEDRGIGVPQADCARLFERYYRGSNVAGIVGTGIGLFFAKTVIELHGGHIGVDSRQAEGSRFTVRLPLLPVAEQEPSSTRLSV